MSKRGPSVRLPAHTCTDQTQHVTSTTHHFQARIARRAHKRRLDSREAQRHPQRLLLQTPAIRPALPLTSHGHPQTHHLPPRRSTRSTASAQAIHPSTRTIALHHTVGTPQPALQCATRKQHRPTRPHVRDLAPPSQGVHLALRDAEQRGDPRHLDALQRVVRLRAVPDHEAAPTTVRSAARSRSTSDDFSTCTSSIAPRSKSGMDTARPEISRSPTLDVPSAAGSSRPRRTRYQYD